MKLLRLFAATLAVALATRAGAYQACPQKTLGDTFLDWFESRLNEGLNAQDYRTPIPGMQLHLDHSGAPPPDGAFVKFPDGWRFDGTDAHNRMPIPPLAFPLTNGGTFELVARVHNINLRYFKTEFDCDPGRWGGALAQGGLSQEWGMNPAGNPNLDLLMGMHIKFRWCFEACVPLTDWCETICVLSVDEWVRTDFIEADLSRDFAVYTSVVPKVSADKKSIDIAGYVDAHEGVDQALVGELYDDAAEIAAIVGVAVCVWWPIGAAIVCEAAVIISALAVLDAYEDELRAIASDKLSSAFDSIVNDLANKPPAGAPPGTVGNQLLATAIERFRAKVRGLQIPERLGTLKVPDFDDVVPFDPPFAPQCQ